MKIPTNIMPWACLPASLAMVLAIPFEQVIKEIGHYGDDLPYVDGVTRKGFHIQECIDVALLHEQSPENFKEKQFNNNLQGFDAMQDWMIKQKVSVAESMFS